MLAVLVVAGLFALHFLPSVSVGGKPLRRVDLLSDVRPDAIVPGDSDTVALPLPPVKPVFVDTCKSGMECIEDYADSADCGMNRFYKALADCEMTGRPVRIAYFGDSFIEADILTGDLRKMFQKRFGGSGVGYVSVTTKIAGFRTTVKQSFEGWESHSITDSVRFRRSMQDMSNRYAFPSPGAYVRLKGDTCGISSCYFIAPDSVVLSASVNGGEVRRFEVAGKGELQSVSVEGKIGSVEWTVERFDSVPVFYAVTMDSPRGVILDNFSTRGSSGQQLLNVPLSVMERYSRFRPYDLVVLQYGLNVASEGVVNYSYYKDAMIKVVDYVKRVFPQASILIVSVGDREVKDEYGELHTMPAVKSLVRYQQLLAAESHVAFWNMFQALGGEGSMERMVNSKPSMANYDYTHINFRGGKHIAKLLFDALMYGKEQYEKRKAYEEK